MHQAIIMVRLVVRTTVIIMELLRLGAEPAIAVVEDCPPEIAIATASK